jgi:hypothetical protein
MNFKIGDRVRGYIFHMGAVGILLEIKENEYRVRVGNNDYWCDRIETVATETDGSLPEVAQTLIRFDSPEDIFS